MTPEKISALRSLILLSERNGLNAKKLYAHEAEYLSAPDGISVIVPIHNGASEMMDLLLSLRNQSLDCTKFEVIFSLNGCSDTSRELIDEFAANSGVSTVVIESPVASVARARNDALQHARFRHATFVDHDDHLSRGYLEQCVSLGDYRSVVVLNIMKIEDGDLKEDYAQEVVARGFEVSHVHTPDDIAICYRAYTLNAIKSAPSYMLRRVRYDESLAHSEDVKYWRDVFRTFTPITIKSPFRFDVYYRKVVKNSLSRRPSSYYEKVKPRFAILDQIAAEAADFSCNSPQRKFDAQLKNLLLNTLFELGRN